MWMQALASKSFIYNQDCVSEFELKIEKIWKKFWIPNQIEIFEKILIQKSASPKKFETKNCETNSNP